MKMKRREGGRGGGHDSDEAKTRSKRTKNQEQHLSIRPAGQPADLGSTANPRVPEPPSNSCGLPNFTCTVPNYTYTICPVQSVLSMGNMFSFSPFLFSEQVGRKESMRSNV
jgi:hypothetical protein